MDLDSFRWLLTDEGQRVLALAMEVADEEPLRAQTLLRKKAGSDVDPAHVAAALTQARLRHRARTKFGDRADRMYFTPDGLEQATTLRVAEHRAARLVAASTRTLIDLCCGIGGDLIACAEAGLVCAGVDPAPQRGGGATPHPAAEGRPRAVGRPPPPPPRGPPSPPPTSRRWACPAR